MILAPVLLAAALLAPAPTPAPPRRVLDRVAATVNGEVITLQELVERSGAEYDRAEALGAGAARDRARADALQRAFDQLVAERLFQAQAVSLGVEATDAQIDQAIEEIKKQNHFDDAQLETALRDQGIDKAEFRKQVKRQIEAYDILRYKVQSRVKVSDDDVRNYYQTHPQEFGGEEEVHVRHIFLPLREDAPPAEVARVQAEGQRVLQRLKTGEDFASLARAVSRGPSAEEGGDLGWLRRGTIQKTLEDAAFALKTGQVSGLVRAGPGLHILKVEDRRRGGGKSFDEAKADIRSRLQGEQVESYRQQYLAELRRDALIDVKLPELKVASEKK